MAELHGPSLGTHLKAIISELKNKDSIYGYPKSKFFLGFDGYDFSVDFHDKKAFTQLGPSSGPHTQMAQNIILSFLGGGRIMELKTVQILDELEIPRPCIDARNICYNVEWSQELKLQESYTEYVNAWILLKIIEDMEILGPPKGDPFYNTVFDLSVGYDLEGIKKPNVKIWLEQMQDASVAIKEALASLPDEFADYRDFEIDPHISNSITLSTFHGCPPTEIEEIVKHLIKEHGFHVIAKLNPTLLGYDFVDKIIHEDLGYEQVILDPPSFEADLQFDVGIAMLKRLKAFAKEHGRLFGAKFTNTLVVKNNQGIFEEGDGLMYMSGAPLHVLAMHSMHAVRSKMGDDFPISFSAGIANHNIVDSVKCNMTPITICTDLLKTGGYTRMFGYMKNIKKAMDKNDAKSIAELIVASEGNGKDLNAAAAAFTTEYIKTLATNPRYHYDKNKKSPPKIDSHLTLFDCITCNKCLHVCPNAANISIPIGELSFPTNNFEFQNGGVVAVDDGTFILEKTAQIANLADFCNECGDCDTYCPEHGGPFIAKPRFFNSEFSYLESADHDGFYFPTANALKGRIGAEEYVLEHNPLNSQYRWISNDAEIVLDKNNKPITELTKASGKIDMTNYYIMKVLLDGLLENSEDYAPIILRG